MKHILRAVLFVSLITVLAVGVFPVAAQISTVDPVGLGIAKGAGADATDNLSTYVKKIINIFLEIVGVVAIIFIIFAGVQLLTAQGDEKKMETAKRTILLAVIGLIIIGLAAALVRFTGDAISDSGTTQPPPKP